MRLKLGLWYPIFGLIILLAVSVRSLPRLSAEHGTPCKTCHINPNGGGMRTEFGNHAVALQELCLPQTKATFLERYKRPRLSESVIVGFDSRHLVFDDGRIFRMQSDAYLAVEPLKDFYYLMRLTERGIAEHYALLYFADERFYVKAGRFNPAYGLHDADHKAYVRERIGYGSNVFLDGLSTGADLFGVSVAGELFNVNEQAVSTLHLLKAGSVDPLGYLAGASVRFSEKVAGSTGAFPPTKAVFGGLSYDRLTLLGELDVTGTSNDTLITYASLTTRLEYGLYLIGEYNFFDGDRHLETGVDEFLRVSLELFPIPFVEFRPSYTYYTRGILKDEQDFFVQVHFGY